MSQTIIEETGETSVATLPQQRQRALERNPRTPPATLVPATRMVGVQRQLTGTLPDPAVPMKSADAAPIEATSTATAPGSRTLRGSLLRRLGFGTPTPDELEQLARRHPVRRDVYADPLLHAFMLTRLK